MYVFFWPSSGPSCTTDDLVQPLLHDVHLANGLLALRLRHHEVFLQLPDLALLVLHVVLEARQRGDDELDLLHLGDQVAGELELAGLELVVGEGLNLLGVLLRLDVLDLVAGAEEVAVVVSVEEMDARDELSRQLGRNALALYRCFPIDEGLNYLVNGILKLGQAVAHSDC